MINGYQLFFHKKYNIINVHTKEVLNLLKKNETALLVIDMQYGGGAPDGSPC